jgi:hypothetical protein
VGFTWTHGDRTQVKHHTDPGNKRISAKRKPKQGSPRLNRAQREEEGIGRWRSGRHQGNSLESPRETLGAEKKNRHNATRLDRPLSPPKPSEAMDIYLQRKLCLRLSAIKDEMIIWAETSLILEYAETEVELAL